MSSPVDSEEEYLLAAYEEYNNDAEEWPNYVKTPNAHIYHGLGGEQWQQWPLLIRECGRLVPVYSKDFEFVQFHPFNMPEIRVRRIHIIGMIMNIKISDKYVRFGAYDGTGCIEVLYKFEWYDNQLKKRAEIDRKYKISREDVEKNERLMKVKTENSPRSSLARQRIEQFQKNHAAWWEECSEGMLGRPLCVGSYVHVFGFCNINLDNISRLAVKDNNFWANDLLPEMIFNAYDVRSMTEKSYNETLQRWVDGVFKEKYVDVKKSTCVTTEV